MGPDAVPCSTNAQDEILVKHLISHAGGMVGLYDDLIYMVAPVANHSGPVILQQTLYDSADLLDSRFENGSEGYVYEQEVIHYSLTTVDGDPESLKSPTPISGGPPQDIGDRGDDKEDYRWTLMLENNRAQDEFGRVIDLSKAFSEPVATLEQAAREVIDLEEWMRAYAVVSLTGNFDVYSVRPMHNIMLYTRPEDDKVMVLLWDQDFAFYLSENAALMDPLNLNTNLTRLMRIPSVQRVFLGQMNDLIETTFNQEYFDRWALNYAYTIGQDYSQHINYIQLRADFVRNQFPPQLDFAISTNGGLDFTVDEDSVVLSGDAWIDVHEIRLAGASTPLDVTWTDGDSWEVTLPVSAGENLLQFEAYDYQGRLTGSDSITVTSTITAPSLQEGVRITEVMYNPYDPPPGSPFDNDAFEYIELTNIAAQPVNLHRRGLWTECSSLSAITPSIRANTWSWCETRWPLNPATEPRSPPPAPMPVICPTAENGSN